MKSIYLTIMAFAVASCLHGQSADSYSGDMLHDYFGKQLEMIPVTPGFTPPVTSRALGYSGLCAYESTVHGMSNKTSLVGIVPQLDILPLPTAGVNYHWGIVTNNAMHALLVGLYNNASTQHLTDLNNIRNAYNVEFSAGTPAEVVSASTTFGTQIGNSILMYANGDGAQNCQLFNFPNDYVIPVGPGLWQPLAGQMALQPYWGEKRCFVVEFVDLSIISPAPPAFSDQVGSELYNEANAVYEAVNNLTTEQQNIAEYWADGGNTLTPPGHSISMLRNIMRYENEDLAFSAEAYARLGMAVSDAFVACWKTKYEYNLLRPIHYINDYIDADWTTVVPTPPFPEYTSGHSTQSGAFGAAMTAIYGNNYAFVDSTHGELYGGPRFFNNFVECAEETAISRLYGGIHFPIGNTEGTVLGANIGEMVNMLFETVVGVNETASNTFIEVYPNPTSGMVTLSVAAAAMVDVFNITGQKVATFTGSRTLDLSGMDAGIYILEVKDMQHNPMGISRVVVE